MSIFQHEHNPVSWRHAVFEDNGVSAWLYLTGPGDKTAQCDVWLYNRIPAPPFDEMAAYKDGPMPAPEEYAGEAALETEPEGRVFEFRWSGDGEAAAILADGVPLGFVQAGADEGWSRNVTRAGVWGKVFDWDLYRGLFEVGEAGEEKK